MYDRILDSEKKHRGFTCKVYYDPDPWSPDDWDMLGTIYSGHRRYNPQKHRMDEIVWFDEEGNWHVDDDYIYVRMYMYEHGGITVWSSREPQRCGWDSGLFGIYAVHKDKAAKEFGDVSNPENYERVMSCLEAEVEDWDTYFRGEVYGYAIEDENGAEIDSCWGFYCKPEEVMKEAISIADWEAEKIEKEEREIAEQIEKYEMICEPFWID